MQKENVFSYFTEKEMKGGVLGGLHANRNIYKIAKVPWMPGGIGLLCLSNL